MSSRQPGRSRSRRSGGSEEVCASERLTDAEVDPPSPRLRLAVDDQTRNRIELIAPVEADGANRRLIAEARADVVPEIVETDPPRFRPHVARIEECDGAEITFEMGPQFGRKEEQAVAANRLPGRAERADLEASPAAKSGRTAQEVLLRERHRARIVRRRGEVCDLNAGGEHHVL